MVLVVTNKEDIASDIVVLALRDHGGSVLRLNLEDAAQSEFIVNPAEGWTISTPQGECHSCDVTGVWCRRPGWPSTYAPVGSVGEFVNEQWTTLLRGLAAFDGPLWVNDPFYAAAAENKILQLTSARAVGLQVPSTFITNSAAEVERVHARVKSVVKALSCPLIEETSEFVFTNMLERENLPDKTSASLAPFIVQEALLPKADIRATIIGNSVFAAEAKSSYVDWRLDDSENLWTPHLLPEGVLGKLLELMKRLRLSFGAIDLVLYENSYYFLEINPTGEWAWIQTSTGMKLADAMARLLILGRRDV